MGKEGTNTLVRIQLSWRRRGKDDGVHPSGGEDVFCCTKHFHCPIDTKGRERRSSWKHRQQSKMAGQELREKESNIKPLWRSQEDQHLKTWSSQLSICWGWEHTRAWEDVPHHIPHQQQPRKLFVTGGDMLKAEQHTPTSLDNYPVLLCYRSQSFSPHFPGKCHSLLG